jgi:hypothetical protein
VLVLLGRLCIFLWKRRPGVASEPSPVAPYNAPTPPPNAAPPEQSRFSKPTPGDMTMQVESLPPFQQETGWNAYRGLHVCWQAVFRGIGEDEPANRANPTAKKKWVVDLKHYDPTIHYSSATICCPGVDIEKHPQFKSLHKNELLIVRGKVESVQYYLGLIYPADFEFLGKRIE